MALSIKFPIVDDHVVIAVDGALGPRERAAAFTSLVARDIERIDARNAAAIGVRIPRETFVDGVATNDLTRAGEHSEIVTRWRVEVGVVEWIWEAVHSAGRVKSGAYRASALLYADGREVATPGETIGAREVLILPTVPYARKIERGLKGYGPGKVYEAIAQAARARFANAARVKFTFAEPEGAAPGLDHWAAAHARRVVAHPGRAAAQHAKNRRQPAILVFLG